MNTNFVKSLLVIGMGLSLAACSSNDPEPKKEDTKVVEAKKEEKKEEKKKEEIPAHSEIFLHQFRSILEYRKGNGNN